MASKFSNLINQSNSKLTREAMTSSVIIHFKCQILISIRKNEGTMHFLNSRFMHKKALKPKMFFVRAEFSM